MENTLIVITSDHGTELYEHRRFDHGFTLYNGQIHLPQFVKLPGQTSGRSIDNRVSSIDIMPTILDLLDVDLPKAASGQLRGASLVPSLQGEPVARDVFSETDYRQYTYKRSIIAPSGWKLIYTLEDRSRELFDLDNDPAETNNLAAAQSQRADELEQRLFAHFESIGHDLRSQRWERGYNPVYGFPAK
jgi:arylsulfatase A-like enzyme